MWHHEVNRPGIMQLVPRIQHGQAGPLQRLFHPNGGGGMAAWGR
jgi:hypothetical protein